VEEFLAVSPGRYHVLNHFEGIYLLDFNPECVDENPRHL